MHRLQRIGKAIVFILPTSAAEALVPIVAIALGTVLPITRVLNRQGIAGNPVALLAIGLVILFQLAFTYFGFMQTLFGSAALNATDWLLSIGVSASVLMFVELEKLVTRRFDGAGRGLLLPGPVRGSASPVFAAAADTPSPDGSNRRAPAAVDADDITAARFDAVLFDLDGVLTATARIHARSWKRIFDDFLRAHSTRVGEAFRAFDVDVEYRRFVDGKPRLDGVRSFLAARGITLPEGTPDSPPDEVSVAGLAKRKDELVTRAIRAGEARTWPDAIMLVKRLRRLGIKTAVVSASHHCAEVLAATGIEGLFDLWVDGANIDRLHLPGKPAPDTYLYAAKRLGVKPSRAVVVEDATAGVRAGKAGGFALVVGVDRGGGAEALRESGADRVVSDLAMLTGTTQRGERR